MIKFLAKAAFAGLLVLPGCRRQPVQYPKLNVGIAETALPLAAAAGLPEAEVRVLRPGELPEALAVGAIDVAVMPLNQLLQASLTYPNLTMLYPYCAKRELYTLLSKRMTSPADQRILNPSEAEAESAFAAQFRDKTITAESSGAEEALYTYLRDRGFDGSFSASVVLRDEAVERVRRDETDGAVVLGAATSGEIRAAAELGRTDIYGFVVSGWTAANRKRDVLDLISAAVGLSRLKSGLFGAVCPISVEKIADSFLSPSGEYYWSRAAEQTAAFIRSKKRDEVIDFPLEKLFRGEELQQELEREASRYSD